MRSVPEWIGYSDDSAPPFRVRLRVLEASNYRCAKCDHKVGAGGERWQCDHAKPLWEGGENRESNLQVLCQACHDFKTRREATQRAKINRVRAKHLGLKKPRTIRAWRRFDGTKVFAGRER